MENKVANKLIMVQDLVDKLRGTLVLQLVKRADLKTLYKNRPKVCPHCQSNNIVGIEIMGIDEDILLWECDSCQCIYLRYDKDLTEKELQIAKSYWTNPKDWGYCPKSQFN